MLADIAEEPSWGHPGRYLAGAGAYSGHIIDINVARHWIVYRYSARENTVFVRLIALKRSF